MFGKDEILATVTSWMPPGVGPDQNAIWHVVHADNDDEDLDANEMEAGI